MKLAIGIALAVAVAACAPIARLASGAPSWREETKTPADFDLVAEHVGFRSSDHLRVAGWWIPARSARATVVLVHGRGGNKSVMLPRARFLVDAGYDVLAIDLRAHGESEGNYPSPGYREKAEVLAAVRYARTRSARPVILLGHSVGGVAVLHAAARDEPAVVAVVADSAFVSFFNLIARARKAQLAGGGASAGARFGMWLVSSPTLGPLVRLATWFATGTDVDPGGGYLVPVLPHIHVPVLFVTGDQDEVAPPRNARNMRRLVPDGLGEVALLHASHMTYDDAPTAYRRSVLGFLDRVLARPATIAAGGGR